MSPDPRERKILFEKYLLGLTTKEEKTQVEQEVAQNPERAAELESVKEQLSHYLDEQGIVRAPFRRMGRSIEDFEDLDHEMIMQMTRRNYVLVVWRYALGGISLLLLLLAGYLFSANQNLRISLTTLEAEAAQRENSLERRLYDLSEMAVDLDSLHSLHFPLDSGEFHLHYIQGVEVVFADLGDAARLGPGQRYFVLVGNQPKELNFVTVDNAVLGELHPLHARDTLLSVWRLPPGTTSMTDTNGLGTLLFQGALPSRILPAAGLQQ